MQVGLPISRKGRAFDGTGAGNTATSKLVIANTYTESRIKYSGVTLAQMTEIRLISNTEVIRRWKGGQELDRENQFFGRAAANGVLILDHSRYHQITRLGREATLFGTGVKSAGGIDANTAYIEIDIDAGAANPVLSVEHELREPQPTGDLLHRRITQISADGAGEIEFDNLHQNFENIYMIEFQSQRMTDLRIERDNKVIFNRSRADNKQILLDEGLRPDLQLFDGANESFVYFPGERGYALDLLVTQRDTDLIFLPTFSQAEANIRVCITSIAPLPAQ